MCLPIGLRPALSSILRAARKPERVCKASRLRAFALIELLVVMALIVILAGGLYTFYAGRGGSGGKKGEQKTPLTAALDSECLQNLGSVRQCIKAEEAGDEEKHPAALTDIKSLTSELRACPVGKEPYVYDPATGQVHCPHPGHENY